MDEKHETFQENINRKVLIDWVRALGLPNSRKKKHDQRIWSRFIKVSAMLYKDKNYNDKSFNVSLEERGNPLAGQCMQESTATILLSGWEKTTQ